MRKAVLLVLVLALVGFAWWLTREESVSRVTHQRHEPAELAPDAREPSAPPLDAPTRPRVDPASPRPADEPATRVAEDGGGLEVFVRDSLGRAAAEAPVSVVASVSSRDRWRLSDLDRVDEWMLVHGEPRVTDAEGRLRIEPPAREPTYLFAFHCDHWGLRRVEPGEPSPIEWWLERDFPLEVEVLYGTGLPCPGLQVSLWSHAPLRLGRKAWTAEGTGIALLPHLQRTVRDGAEWTVGLDALLVEPIDIPIEPFVLPESPLTIVLPATGVVEVSVLSPRGTPELDEVTVTLSLVHEEAASVRSSIEAHRFSLHRRVSEGRVARFEAVEAGHRLELAVREQLNGAVTRVEEPGLARAGETVRYEVRLGSDHPVVLFRALDAKGRPLASARLGVHVTSIVDGRSYRTGAPVDTDADGYATADLAGGWRDGETRRLLVTLGRDLEKEARATVELSYPLELGINDLGDLVLGPERTILVAGRVVTRGGAPVGGALLEVSRLDESGAHWGFAPIPAYGIEGPKADEQGGFEIRERPEGERFRLRAESPGLVGPPIEFTAGDRGVVVVLDGEGRIVGSVLRDAAIPLGELQVTLVESTESGEQPNLRYRKATVRADGAFELGALLPGSYEVTLRARNVADELAAAPGVEVAAGETTRDPRLQGIDLRGLLHVHRVSIDSRPTLSRWGRLRHRPAGAAGWGEWVLFNEDGLTLVTLAPRLDLELTAPGYRTVRLDDVGEEVEARLDVGFPVRLRLPASVSLPEPPYLLKAQLTPPGGVDDALVDLFGPAFDERREVSVTAPATGPMEVAWIVERRRDDGSSPRVVPSAPRRTVDVRDLPGEQLFVLEITPEEVAEILAAGR